jgi:hypothetical protein
MRDSSISAPLARKEIAKADQSRLLPLNPGKNLVGEKSIFHGVRADGPTGKSFDGMGWPAWGGGRPFSMEEDGVVDWPSVGSSRLQSASVGSSRLQSAPVGFSRLQSAFFRVFFSGGEVFGSQARRGRDGSMQNWFCFAWQHLKGLWKIFYQNSRTVRRGCE